MIEKLKRIYRYYFKSQPKFRVTHKAKIERHGTVYGGWNIIRESINQDSIVYSFGIGEDISFDESIIDKYKCNVYGFDPTPKVLKWIEKENVSPLFIFTPVALSDYDGTLTFYEPTNTNHVSHTAYSNGSSKRVSVPCKKLSTICKSLGHKTIDILKIDIEGFEYTVLKNILDEKLPIRQLLVEFHHFFPEVGNKPTEDMIMLLEQNGYNLFSVSDSFCEYSFF